MSHTLLLVDDSLTIRRLVELTFAEEHVDVTAVADGAEAIDCLPALRPDIVLADVGMASPDGYDVAAFVKGNPELAHVPVILLTAAFQPIDEARAAEVRCDGVLGKPFELTLLVSRVKELLGETAPQGADGGEARAEQDALPAEAGEPAEDGTERDSLDDAFDRAEEALRWSPPPATPRDPLAESWTVERDGERLSLDEFFEAVEASVRGERGGGATASGIAPLDAAPAEAASAFSPPSPSSSAAPSNGSGPHTTQETSQEAPNAEAVDPVTRVFLALLQSPVGQVPPDAFDRAVRALLKE